MGIRSLSFLSQVLSRDLNFYILFREVCSGFCRGVAIFLNFPHFFWGMEGSGLNVLWVLLQMNWRSLSCSLVDDIGLLFFEILLYALFIFRCHLCCFYSAPPPYFWYIFQLNVLHQLYGTRFIFYVSYLTVHISFPTSVLLLIINVVWLFWMFRFVMHSSY